MSYPFNRLGNALFPGLCAILPVVGVRGAPAPIFFHSGVSASHISVDFTLYKKDTVMYHSAPGFISREKNGDLIIAVPSASMGRYSIRFYDGDHYFLFEIGKISDPKLIIEKSNFQHTGTFRYELYHDRTLIEKGSFVIKDDEMQMK